MTISIILLEPKNPGNIGSVARVMKNFGFSNLVLVNPCKLDEEANMMAVHAKDILRNAKTVEKFDDLDFDLLVGTTCVSTPKDDYFLRMSMAPKDLKNKLEKVEGNIALIFGREDDGLSNEELEKCDLCVTIPTSDNYKSMNLSHAVAVVLYELSNVEKSGNVRLASKRELDLIKSNICEIIKDINYPVEKRKVFNTMIKRILGRALITGREANTLIGALKKILKRISQ